VAHDVADSLAWRASALVADLEALERDCRGVEVAFAPFDLGRAATGTWAASPELDQAFDADGYHGRVFVAPEDDIVVLLSIRQP